MVNPNYKEINAKEQLSRKDSVFYFYKELIRLRKEYDIILWYIPIITAGRSGSLCV